MKIAFNPSTVAALTTPPNNKDITFDLRGRNIFARGVKFYGTDTNTWRDIKINNVSIGSHTLDLRNGGNTTLTNTNGIVTINSTWRPVVDNLTSNSTTSSLSANQGRVLKALIDGKSNSGHTHDDRYLRLSGGTMNSDALIKFADSGSWGTDKGPQGARGGLYWSGQSDYAKLYAEETAGDNLDLVIQFGDDNSNGLSIRNKSNVQTSYISAGGVITTGTFKGNLGWSYITNKPSSYTPSAHTHAWNSLTHSSTTANQAILTNGSANGWKLYTLNISAWDNAANKAHSHANKSVLDGITSGLVSNWNTAYNFVSTISGSNTDKIINKWDEIVNFLAGIDSSNKLNTLLNSKLSVYELADKTNVGTIKNNGIYYSTSDASTDTLTNSPFNTGFALINMTSYDGGDDLRRSRLAFNAYGEIKVSDDRSQSNTAETWYNVLTSKNSGISGSTIKLNGTSITVYSSGTADGRYVKRSGDTMSGALNFANGTWNKVGDDSYMGDCNVSGHFGVRAANTTYPGIAFFNNANAHLGSLTAYSGNIKYGAYSLQFLDNGNTSVNAGTWTNPFSAYDKNAVKDGQAICVWGQSSYLSNLASDSGDMSLWLKRINAKAATLNMVLDGEYYANGTQRLAHVSEIPSSLKNPYALTISLNGTSQGPYDGSAAKSINITPGSIGAATSGHNHDGRYVYNYGGTQMDGSSRNKNALGMSTTSGISGDWWHILQAAWNDEYRWNSQIAFPTQNRNGMYYRSGLDDNTKWGAWVKLLDINNYSSTLDSRYYTESEVDTLLDAKLNRQNLSYGTWNPRGYHLAADYCYNGGDLSISESGGQIHVSIDGYFWQNEGQYRVLDTSDVAGLKGNLTVRQYLSNTDTTWWPLIWGGSSHANTSDSTGAVYKSHDVLSWQTSSQTLYATKLRTINLDTQTAFFHPGNDSTLKIYSGRTQNAVSDGHIGLQTSIDNTDGQTHVYPTQYGSRCVLALQPRGGSVYIGNMPNGGNGRKLNVNGDIGLFNTGSIRDLAIGGGIYWNPNVESASDGSDVASITLVKAGVAGGTTLVLSQMNDANDTIQFKTNAAARLYHNSYPILTTQNTYVNNHKGYINGTEITQVNNADTVDGWHKDEINRTLFITSGISGLSSYWAKLWEINLNNQYNDVTITFLAAASYYPSYFSIFSVYLRQNGSGTSKGIDARLVELIGNIAVGDTELRLYVNNTTGNCQLWGNVKGQYGTMNLSVLKKAWRTNTDSSNIGTFFSTSFSSVQPLPGDGWYKVGVIQQGVVGAFNPASHTHTWTSITDKIVAGNEFNVVNAGFKEDLWFNYLPINDRNKTATISGYHFGNGARGYAAVKASGFIKNGSNDSYVLLGGGSHKTESSLRVAYASSAGSATSATKVIVNQHTTNDINYPLVWSNQANTNNVTENQLHKSWADLYYNPKNKRLTVGGSVVSSSFVKSGGTSQQLLRADGGIASFNWTGQSGQPTWLWGGNSQHSYYVYNPSNFRVAYAASAGNADTLDGEHASSFVRAGAIEVGSPDLNALDTYSFIKSVNSQVASHSPKGNIGWYNVIQLVHRNGADDGPSYIGQIALGMTTNTDDMFFRGKRTDPWKTVIHSGNIGSQTVASASKLVTARKIWGQSFNGTADVNGTIYINNGDSENGAIILNNNVNTHARISAIKDNVVFNTGGAIRFGDLDWDYSKWAGLKYNYLTKTIYLGIADGSIFTTYGNVQNEGILNLRANISHIDLNSGTSIRGLGTDGSPYYSSITLKDTSMSLSAYGDMTMSTGPGTMQLSTGNAFRVTANDIRLTCKEGYMTCSQTGSSEYTWIFNNNIKTSGQIIRGGSSQAWVNGRKGALLRETSVAGYHTLWSLKTTDGSWDFGEFNSSGWNNIPVLSYILDSNFNKGSNTITYQIKFPLASGTVALTSNILNPTNYYWANVKVSASSSTTTSPTVHTLTATNALNVGSTLSINGSVIDCSADYISIKSKKSGSLIANNREAIRYDSNVVNINNVACFLQGLCLSTDIYRVQSNGLNIPLITTDGVTVLITTIVQSTSFYFRNASDGQLLFLKVGKKFSNVYFWCSADDCEVVKANSFDVHLGKNVTKDYFADGLARIFIYKAIEKRWYEFYCG